MVEQKGKYFYENEDIQRTHEILDTANCFSNIGVEYRSVFPIKIKTRPCIIILRRKNGVVPPQMKPRLIEATKINGVNIPDGTADTEDTGDFNDDAKAVDDTANMEDEYIDDTENIENSDAIDDIDDASDLDDILSPMENGSLNQMDHDEHGNIDETDLKKPTTETKHKLKKLIVKHYQQKAAKVFPNDRTDLVTASKHSIKSNIKQIIKKEKIKELIEKISQIDLRTVCDLERESTKQCLLKIIDSHMD